MGRPYSEPNRRVLAGAFCALFFLAALMSYSRMGSAGSYNMQGRISKPEDDGFFEKPEESNLRSNDSRDEDELETLVVDQNIDITNEKNVILKRPDDGADQNGEHAFDEEGEATSDGNDEFDATGEDGNDHSMSDTDDEIGSDDPYSEAAEAIEMAKIMANAPNYIPTDEDCKTTKRHKQVGVFNKGPRFQYVHIPKTGGTSIQLEMSTWVFHTDVKIIIIKNDMPNIKGSSFTCPAHAEDSSYLLGHRGFGYCRDIEYSRKGLFTFATFRSSASRIVSLFDYNRNREEIRTIRVFGTVPLNDWIKKYNSTPEIEEGEALLRFHGSQQIRFMCGYECIGQNAWGNKTVNLPFMMKRALANLNKLDAIGLTEELNEVIRQLRMHMSYLPGGFKQWPKQNTVMKGSRSILDRQARAILEEWAKPDQMFYQAAVAVYKRKQAIARHCNKLGWKREWWK